jgi:1-deoxy-D-xylulose-5-phosphate synthase
MALLDHVNLPTDLKELQRSELPTFAEELREEIIRVCSVTGGHLASNLGVVELTVALHYLFNARRDRIIWDVGHQTYGHKILTGRKNLMNTIRKPGGLAGFTATSESEYDALTVGHASTSLAAALGMALARDAHNENYDIAAVIGDGALTGGLALAALNQIGHIKPRMVIVLNDNEMSISENVGALNHYMNHLQVQPWFQKAETRSKKVLSGIWTPLADLGSRAKKAARRFFNPASANPFHAMGLRYVGPVDGHNVLEVLYLLERIRGLEGPTMLHIVTKKGKGYDIAEADPILWHGATKFDLKKPVYSGKSYQWSDAFGDIATQLADQDNRIWVITPAMREGSGLVEYSQRHPDRYLDVGIAEDVAVATSAGLALQGQKPILAIYSTFLQRGLDQVVHDISIENLNVIFAIDRAGLVGGDGATHQGIYDIGYLRIIPNLSVAMPRNVPELRSMLKAALDIDGPVALRWPRGGTERASDLPVEAWPNLEWGTWEIVKPGTDAYIIGIGPTVEYGLHAADDNPRVGVVNARFVKPLDEELLLSLANCAKVLITVEDHTVVGGLGSAVGEVLQKHGVGSSLVCLGIPDIVVPHGDPIIQHEELGYGPKALRERVEALGLGKPISSGAVAGTKHTLR